MIEWREPAPTPETGTRGAAAHFEQAARELQGKPHRWGIVATYNRGSSAYNTVTRIKHGQGAWGPSGAYEALAQKDPHKRSTWNVFARYVGSASVRVTTTTGTAVTQHGANGAQTTGKTGGEEENERHYRVAGGERVNNSETKRHVRVNEYSV